MALTIANVNSRADDVFGRHRVKHVKVTFDSSYASGGESFTPADVGMAAFDIVLCSPEAPSGYVVQYDYANKKLLAYGVEQDADAAVTEPLDQENASADLSALVVRVLCIGE